MAVFRRIQQVARQLFFFGRHLCRHVHRHGSIIPQSLSRLIIVTGFPPMLLGKSTRAARAQPAAPPAGSSRIASTERSAARAAAFFSDLHADATHHEINSASWRKPNLVRRFQPRAGKRLGGLLMQPLRNPPRRRAACKSAAVTLLRLASMPCASPSFLRPIVPCSSPSNNQNQLFTCVYACFAVL